MSTNGKAGEQRGATLVVTLVMLLMLMLMVGSAYTLSGTNLKAVGNMQFRNEAIAAANVGIQQVIGSSFATTPTGTQPINVDINNDGVTDYTVIVAPPVCSGARQTGNSSLCGMGTKNMCTQSWNTTWTLNASVTDNVSGAAVKVRSGVRVQLTDSQKLAACGA
ncbi:hypothetical protein [Pseudomonas sp. SCB32]|uniref:hypothetical protein n=1 Tax=Pseudomonas sp. SCB32 TaxID=2653853 RepID=UPI00126458E0|nr:hypothetical protein [Pseudomonas sp. SCB32]